MYRHSGPRSDPDPIVVDRVTCVLRDTVTPERVQAALDDLGPDVDCPHAAVSAPALPQPARQRRRPVTGFAAKLDRNVVEAFRAARSPAVRPDPAAVALLLGRPLREQRRTVRLLRRGAPLLIIAPERAGDSENAAQGVREAVLKGRAGAILARTATAPSPKRCGTRTGCSRTTRPFASGATTGRDGRRSGPGPNT